LPRGWQLDPSGREVTIWDADNVPETYRVLPLPAEFGRGWELIVGGGRFGLAYEVHIEGQSVSCSCPSGTYRGGDGHNGCAVACKHAVAICCLCAGGLI
jgi:hypothetical protein